MSMLVDLFRAIQNSGETQIISAYERQYTTRELKPILSPPISPLCVSNLTSLLEYVNEWSSKDIGSDMPLLIHVVSPTQVNVWLPLDPTFYQRHCILKADGNLRWDLSGRWMDPESFIISLRSLFVQDEVTEQILKLVSNIEDSKVLISSDDGISQTVNAKVGIIRKDNIVIPPIVSLRPYRTFIEIEQPKSDFMFRMQSGVKEGSPPSIMLGGIDGGAWENQAMASIKQYLKDRLPAGTVILA